MSNHRSQRVTVVDLNSNAFNGNSIGMGEIDVIGAAIEKTRAMVLGARGPYLLHTILSPCSEATSMRWCRCTAVRVKSR